MLLNRDIQVEKNGLINFIYSVNIGKERSEVV